MGRNLEDSQTSYETKERICKIRPKSEKLRTVDASLKRTQTSSINLLKKNLDDYIFSLSNFELKQKLESCPGKLGECPLLNDFREELRKSLSNHHSLIEKNDQRLCKTSHNYGSAKESHEMSERENIKMASFIKSSEKKEAVKDEKSVKAIFSNTSRGVIRSTRAQDLRSQSNRDLLKPKTTTDKARTTVSPYVTALPLKKKKCSGGPLAEGKGNGRGGLPKPSDEKKKLAKVSNPVDKGARFPPKAKVKKEKPSTATESSSLQRQKTQEIVNPKFVKKTSSNVSTTLAGNPPGEGELPQLKKSQTFFICKGTKNGQGDAKPDPVDKTDPASDGNASEDDLLSPKLKPLTHNDSFCLIVKSSLNWSQKNRSDDEKLLHTYDMACEEQPKKTAREKGILKNANYDLKSVDSLEKIDSEKIVRFSDETTHNKKVLKKLVRRKKRFQNFFTPNWYQKNTMFQKYLQILREKSVLLTEQTDIPDELKPYRVSKFLKERYEAEMFGLSTRKGKSNKNCSKDAYSY